MKTLKYIQILSFAVLMLLMTSCQKEFLEAKPDKALLVPTTLDDFQALLDNNGQMNRGTYLTFVGADDLVFTEAGYNSTSITNKNAYIWSEVIYQGEQQADWSFPYVQVFYSNIVLDGLAELKEKDGLSYQAIKGAALFCRSFAFAQLLQNYSAAYQPSTANQEMGIPILLKSNVNQKYGRGTIQQGYDQIINDVKTAVSLLPVVANNVNRPNKAAAWALLARVYLCMADYSAALQASNECLKLNAQLLDYNSLSLNTKVATIFFPFIVPKNLNPEVIFNMSMSSPSLVNGGTTSVNPEVLNSYATNDLRRSAFIFDRGNGVFTFKGKYSGSSPVFTGLATDEILLTRAECNARLNQADAALADLNTLLVKRFKTGTYTPYNSNATTDVLKLVLAERRKELLCRGTRWMDLKRLNLEPANAVTQSRTVGGKTYTLLPNSRRYVLPIPDEEVINSGLAQNPL